MNRVILILLAFLCVSGSNHIRQCAEENDLTCKDDVVQKGERKQGEWKKNSCDRIRVLIKTTDWAAIYHEKLRISGDMDLLVKRERGCQRYRKGEIVTFAAGDDLKAGEHVFITPVRLTGKVNVLSLERACQNPWYRGKIELYAAKDGIVMINELPLEEYLYGVVGSEMPAGYEAEALKAQAVAARTYAVRHILSPGYPEENAALDDSTSFQVYGNIEECDTVKQAVDATRGLVLCEEKAPAEIMYYSTSMGKSEKSLAEEADFIDFLEKKGTDLPECKLPYFRWKTELESRSISQCREICGHPIGALKEIKVCERREDGRVKSLLLKGSRDSVKLQSEYEIRKLMAGLCMDICRQDNTTVEAGGLLPSAYFYLKKKAQGGYEVYGGGFGHGNGMSQNGANEMAKEGADYKEILKYYYENLEIMESK